VALVSGGDVLASQSEDMARGHVERLAPMVAEVLEQGGVAASDLDRIGVTRGPGGFTGARLGVAFARGLALSTGARAVGVSTLEALGAQMGPATVMLALQGAKGYLFVQVFEQGRAISEPEAVPASDADALDACSRRFGEPPLRRSPDLPAIDPVTVARLALADEVAAVPVPLYLRPPDAKAAVRPVLR
jgi:tRNA threonylcarbamoyladenosine biosynthesis protein TsaB